MKYLPRNYGEGDTLLVQALLECKLRLAINASGPTRCHCTTRRGGRAPTSRRIIDLFENVHLQELASPVANSPLRFATALSELQSEVLRLLRAPATDYNA